ncbi:hypothetical protein J6590_087867 [Homalodisca vitripennis]|nr:hypothetical protein J6590_087867 [Homalodisca vitripennis]
MPVDFMELRGFLFDIKHQEDGETSSSSSIIDLSTLSRGERLVKLATNVKHCEGTFVVNSDGSLSNFEHDNKQLILDVTSNVDDAETNLGLSNNDIHLNLLSSDILISVPSPLPNEPDDFLMDIATTGNISIDPDTIQNISGLLDHIENEDEKQYNVNDESKICRNNCEEKIVEKIQEKNLCLELMDI